MRGLDFTLGLDRKNTRERFHSLHRSSGVGEVIQTIMDKNNIQRSAFPSKRRKEISILTDLRSPLQRSEQYEISCKLTHIVILTHNAVRRVTNLLCQSTVLG